MNDAFEIKDPEIEKVLQTLGRYLKAKMPPGMGYTLLMHTIGESGATFYVSSVEREGAVAAMKEFLVKQGALAPEPILSPIKIEEVSGRGLPPDVEKMKAAGAVLIKAAASANAPYLCLKMGGFIAFGVPPSEWEIEVRKKG